MRNLQKNEKLQIGLLEVTHLEGQHAIAGTNSARRLVAVWH
jgi:hypothetical protein